MLGDMTVHLIVEYRLSPLTIMAECAKRLGLKIEAKRLEEKGLGGNI